MIIRVEILVCEEDYKHSLSDWKNHSPEMRLEILKDVNDPEQSFIWRETWLVDTDLNSDADWTIHELMGREYHVMLDTEVKICD